MPSDTQRLIQRALTARRAIPGFNIPYLPMMAPVVQALRDTDSFGLLMVARLEWEKFEARSVEAVAAEFGRVQDPRHVRLHLDHVPVIDEDDRSVDWENVMTRALAAGYGSVMIDGSRLPLAENIACTRRVVELAHAVGVPVEAELGAVLGHETGPLPPYDELFASGRGFTDPDEARRFVTETGVDWLSVAVGSVHGAISQARKDERKVEARLNLEQLRRLRAATGVPLVLHGGTGIRKEYVMAAIADGIAKVNVATALRQPYERALRTDPATAAAAVYAATINVIRNDLETVGLAAQLGLAS